MACAELLAVCLLSANRGPAPRRQPLPIFHDVNDGKLSFEEFKNYFADGILSSEELWELFSGIDRRHSDNVDTEKLCGIWGILSPSPQRYETSSKMEQFLTRFLLRETLQQLQSLQASLECAVDTVEEQAGRDRKDIKKPETSVGLRSGRRCGRRGQKNVCLSPTDPYSGMLTTGTCIPAIPQLVSAPLEQGWEQQHGAEPGPPPPDASWSVSLTASWQGPCALALGLLGPLWLLSASPPGPISVSLLSRSVSACKLRDEACFILYEFWQDATAWRSHLQSSCSKTFQRSIISLLESPELLTTMLFPASWWIMNNN
ncbi:NECA3 protein, partial [Eolophus roseicapillus]|nr:NECA3 protein [Eolophus roseicapilla]